MTRDFVFVGRVCAMVEVKLRCNMFAIGQLFGARLFVSQLAESKIRLDKR